MEFRVLGPLEVLAGGVPLPLGPRKQQTVLALLAVRHGQVVSLDELIDELWHEAPPASAAANARGYAANLRRLLRSAAPDRELLVRRGPGQVLLVDPCELDLLEFSAAAGAGRDELRRDDTKAAAALFRDALACWRGPILAGAALGPALTARCALVEDERLAVVEELADVLLRLGEPEEALGLLREQVPAQPLRERGHLLLMRALYRLGDVPGALTAYTTARGALREQLGIDPGPRLQEMHRAVLNRDADPFAPTATAATVHAPHRPAQLPLDVYGFTGRQRELAALDALLDGAGAQRTAVVISALAGTAGVGKTAVAVHWAHRVRDRFPDGQLYVNLRGFDPSATPVRAAEAVRGFLDALDVPPPRIPAELAAQTALYRSLLAERRMLVVLDNARDADQVRPLLPGSPGCLVLVTSRNQMPGLIATEGARPLHLDLLTPDEARALLAARLGDDCVAAEPDAVNEIIRRCARLPLALAIAAARAATTPDRPLAALAEELHKSLDTLDAGDAATDVRSVFSWSYHTLSPPAAHLFRLLGVHPGPDIGTLAAASLAGLPVADVKPLLAELTRAHLLSEPVPGRYAFHDLLRAYATELATTDPGHRDALHRILDHYLHTAHTAAALFDAKWKPLVLSQPQTGVTPGTLADRRQSLSWFTTEHHVLIAAVTHAYHARFDTHAWQIARTLGNYYRGQGHFLDSLATHRTALDAARRLGDTSAQLDIDRSLAMTCGYLQRYDEAEVHLARSQPFQDPALDPHQHAIRAFLARRQGQYREAVGHAERAVAAARANGDRVGEARAIDFVGHYKTLAGDHDEAIGALGRAITIQEEIDDGLGLASSLNSLGFACHRSGQLQRAVECYQRALPLARQHSERREEARILDHLGDARQALGEPDAARDAWQEALAIFDDIGQPEADTVRAKLAIKDLIDDGNAVSGRRAPS